MTGLYWPDSEHDFDRRDDSYWEDVRKHGKCLKK